MTMLFSFFSPSPFQLLCVAVIALLLFGNRLPSVMRSLGKGVTEFKNGISGIENEIKNSTDLNKEEDSSSNKSDKSV